MRKDTTYAAKTSMNLFYRPDRTTKPSTIALHVLFAVVLMMGLFKWLVFDVWMEKVAAEQALTAAQDELNSVLFQLTDYNEVRERYFRYGATDEERSLVDRMEVLAMLENAVGYARMDSVFINGDQVQIQLSNVTLTEVADIVSRLELSPLVEDTVVHTASKGTAGGSMSWWHDTDSTDEQDVVQANITIQLYREEEEASETDELFEEVDVE